MDWFLHAFDHPLYFEIYKDKEADAAEEGPALAALLNLPPGSRVLDLPCGWGRLHPALIQRGFQVIGGDISALSLARHQREHPGTLLRLDLRSLPFRDQLADAVFCAFTSWGYFESREENLRQLQEFARILHPSGVLLLDLAGRNWLLKASRQIEGSWIRYGGAYLERVCWNPDRSRILTERKMAGESFFQNIWIPTHNEILADLSAAGFRLDQAFGGLDGCPWDPESERWIYRAVREPTPR